MGWGGETKPVRAEASGTQLFEKCPAGPLDVEFEGHQGAVDVEDRCDCQTVLDLPLRKEDEDGYAGEADGYREDRERSKCI